MILTSNRQPENITLSPIGSMTGQCEELVVAGRLTYIRASYDDDVGLNGIEYFQGDERTEYGDLNRRTDDWQILQESPMVGIYGHSSERGVEKLGIITLDLECQEALPIEEEETPQSEGALKGDEQDEFGFGLSSKNQAIIGLCSLVLLLILLILVICAVKVQSNKSTNTTNNKPIKD